MLSITRRPCLIGSSINTRTEKHWDEDVPACDIPLDGIMLEPEELNALLGDAYAHNALFNHRSGGKLDEPMFKQFKPLQLKDKFEEGEATLYLGMHSEVVRLAAVKLSRVTLDPQVGGLTALSLQVQATPDLAELSKVLGYMSRSIEVEVSFGKKTAKESKQQELPINTFGEGEQPEQKSRRNRRRKGNGEQPAAH